MYNYITDCSPKKKCFRVQVTDTLTSTVQRTLRESGLHGRIAAKKPSEQVISACVVQTGRRRCGGALLVTRSVIYLEFKAHLTSMTTTEFCSDTPSHLVCA
jgi:hypothetical protein